MCFFILTANVPGAWAGACVFVPQQRVLCCCIKDTKSIACNTGSDSYLQGSSWFRGAKRGGRRTSFSYGPSQLIQTACLRTEFDFHISSFLLLAQKKRSKEKDSTNAALSPHGQTSHCTSPERATPFVHSPHRQALNNSIFKFCDSTG